ncbi:hypothetical protein [Mesorhizobium sp. 8]|uniref:hypothetical protein n=1 Tax=Mesorhizobium sp. 8 TaxID=2584466 RepID=UPI0015D66AE8|nr:hypothetical protein [Mesorhizobium sp. 8]
MGRNVPLNAVLTLAEAHARRRDNARRRPVDAEDAALQQELDAVLAALIYKLARRT